MIKKRIKCPRCGKPLLQGYGTAVKEVICTCGYVLNVKNLKEDKNKCQKQN